MPVPGTLPVSAVVIFKLLYEGSFVEGRRDVMLPETIHKHPHYDYNTLSDKHPHDEGHLVTQSLHHENRQGRGSQPLGLAERGAATHHTSNHTRVNFHSEAIDEIGMTKTNDVGADMKEERQTAQAFLKVQKSVAESSVNLFQTVRTLMVMAAQGQSGESLVMQYATWILVAAVIVCALWLLAQCVRYTSNSLVGKPGTPVQDGDKTQDAKKDTWNMKKARAARVTQAALIAAKALQHQKDHEEDHASHGAHSTAFKRMESQHDPSGKQSVRLSEHQSALQAPKEHVKEEQMNPYHTDENEPQLVQCLIEGQELKPLGFKDQFPIAIGQTARKLQWLPLVEAHELKMPLYGTSLSELEEKDIESTPRNSTRGCMYGHVSPQAEMLIDPIPAPWSPQALEDTLKQYDIDMSAWEPDQLENLAMEVATGRSFLVSSEEGSLRRTMDIVSVIVVNPDSGKAIVLDNVKMSPRTNGDEEISEVSPSVHKLPHETVIEAARRCIRDQLGAPESAIELRGFRVKALDEDQIAGSYPGLNMIKRRRIIQGFLNTESESVLRHFGLGTSGKPALSHSGSLGNIPVQHDFFETRHDTTVSTVYRWVWKAVDSVPEYAKLKSWIDMNGSRNGALAKKTPKAKDLKRMRTQRASGRFVDQASELETIEVIQPWTISAVETILEEHRMSAANFGLTIAELSQLVSKNSAYLGRRRADGRLVVVTDIVELRVVSPNGQAVLSEIHGPHGQEKARWLRSKQRLDETAWDVARRIARSQLDLDDDALVMYYTPMEIKSSISRGGSSEGPTGPPASSQQAWMGWGSNLDLTGERRWLMTAHIKKGNVEMCSNLHASQL